MTGVMITINRVSDEPYIARFDVAGLEHIANKEKKIPLEWITGNGTDVGAEMMAYLRPLVTKPATELMEGGLPRFFRFDHSRLVNPPDVR